MKSSMLATTRTLIRSSTVPGVLRSTACQRNNFHGLTNRAFRNHRDFRRQQANQTTRRRRFSTATAEEVAKEPSYDTLKIIAIGQAIPFIGFGFMDNAILIVAGDAIDT